MLAWLPQWFDLLEILFPWKPIKALWLLLFLRFLDSCGSCRLGGRLIFFQGDVVHSSHLGLVWGGVGQGVRWGQVAIYQAKAAQFLCTVYSYLPSPFANAGVSQLGYIFQLLELSSPIFSMRTSCLESSKLIENRQPRKKSKKCSDKSANIERRKTLQWKYNNQWTCTEFSKFRKQKQFPYWHWSLVNGLAESWTFDIPKRMGFCKHCEHFMFFTLSWPACWRACLGWFGLVVPQFASSDSLSLKLNEWFAMHVYLDNVDKYDIRCDIRYTHRTWYSRAKSIVSLWGFRTASASRCWRTALKGGAGRQRVSTLWHLHWLNGW